MNTSGLKQLPAPTTLHGYGVTLLPLSDAHANALEEVVHDGRLWELRVTSIPEPGGVAAYIKQALAGQKDGIMLPFAVVDDQSKDIIGCTRYHDIMPALGRLEIGYTWYGQRWQRSHVNTATKLLLLRHAFDTLGSKAVGWRTDNFNLASQRAIERLGAHKDGVLRHHALRRDGTVRDTVLYSLLAGEWPEVEKHLEYQLMRHSTLNNGISA